MNLLQALKAQFSTPDTLTRRFLRTWMPHPGSVLFTLVVVGLVLFVRDVSAFPLLGATTQTTTNSTISYQGYLTNQNGEPLDNVKLDMVFRLYDAADAPYDRNSCVQASGCLWSESQSVAVTDGVFLVELGSQEALSDQILQTKDLWIGIRVGGDAEMTPRQQLTSVPRAVNAERLDGVDAGIYITPQELETTLRPITTVIESLVISVPRAVNADRLGGEDAGTYVTQSTVQPLVATVESFATSVPRAMNADLLGGVDASAFASSADLTTITDSIFPMIEIVRGADITSTANRTIVNDVFCAADYTAIAVMCNTGGNTRISINGTRVDGTRATCRFSNTYGGGGSTRA
ncbi:MAG: hypothetical protein R3A44_32415 [Caldilineaceae bacterium]